MKNEACALLMVVFTRNGTSDLNYKASRTRDATAGAAQQQQKKRGASMCVADGGKERGGGEKGEGRGGGRGRW